MIPRGRFPVKVAQGAALQFVRSGGSQLPVGSTRHNDSFARDAMSPAPTSEPRVYLLNRYRPPDISLSEALRALRAYSFSEEPETVELSIKCNMEYKRNKFIQPFRGSLTYPHKFGKLQKLLFIGEEDQFNMTAQAAGADIVGGEELLDQLQLGELEDFDLCLCTVVMYEKVKKFDRILRAKTPSLRKGTVVESGDIPAVVSKFKQSLEYRTQHGCVNMPVGKLDFSEDQIQTNVATLLETVLTHKASSMTKGDL